MNWDECSGGKVAQFWGWQIISLEKVIACRSYFPPTLFWQRPGKARLPLESWNWRSEFVAFSMGASDSCWNENPRYLFNGKLWSLRSDSMDGKPDLTWQDISWGGDLSPPEGGPPWLLGCELPNIPFLQYPTLCPAYQFQTAPQTKGYQESSSRKTGCEKRKCNLHVMAFYVYQTCSLF